MLDRVGVQFGGALQPGQRTLGLAQPRVNHGKGKRVEGFKGRAPVNTVPPVLDGERKATGFGLDGHKGGHAERGARLMLRRA